MSETATAGDAGWPTVEVCAPDDVESDDEQMGSKKKFWIEREDGKLWLFKFARDREDEQGVRCEDLAEYVVHRLATLIGVPTAMVVPAVCRGRRGVLSRNVVSDPHAGLVHGNELLAAEIEGYDKRIERENPDYTVNNVHLALDCVGAKRPAGFDGPTDLDGFDVWTGYLLLDAWVAGRDRHHENWAVIRGPEGVTLAPSFDHGNALGFQEREESVERLARDRDALRKWARRGTSHHFVGRPLLTEVAGAALSLASSAAQRHWRSRLSAVNFEEVEQMVCAVPSTIASESRASFVIELLKENQRRLIDGD